MLTLLRVVLFPGESWKSTRSSRSLSTACPVGKPVFWFRTSSPGHDIQYHMLGQITVVAKWINILDSHNSVRHYKASAQKPYRALGQLQNFGIGHSITFIWLQIVALAYHDVKVCEKSEHCLYWRFSHSESRALHSSCGALVTNWMCLKMWQRWNLTANNGDRESFQFLLRMFWWPSS